MSTKDFRGPYFRTLRALVRGVCPPRRAPEPIDGPCVILCRHKDLRGPILSLCWMDTPAHPWIYHVFCAREACYRQFRDYTLTVRLRWPKWFSLFVARAASIFLPPLMRSLGGVPVYRGSAKAMITLRETLMCLLRGEPVVIYPDIDYTNRTKEVGALYDGFVVLARLYAQKTGRALEFLPMAVGDRCVRFGAGVWAPQGNMDACARRAFVDTIAQALQALERAGE